MEAVELADGKYWRIGERNVGNLRVGVSLNGTVPSFSLPLLCLLFRDLIDLSLILKWFGYSSAWSWPVRTKSFIVRIALRQDMQILIHLFHHLIWLLFFLPFLFHCFIHWLSCMSITLSVLIVASVRSISDWFLRWNASSVTISPAMTWKLREVWWNISIYWFRFLWPIVWVAAESTEGGDSCWKDCKAKCAHFVGIIQFIFSSKNFSILDV